MSDTPTPAQADEKALERALEALRLADAALEDFERYGCPVCGGDCASANPPVYSCPMQACIEARRRIRAALASDASPSGEPYCWVRETGGHFDPQHGGEPPTIEFLPENAPGAFPLFRGATPPAKEHRHDD